jgi:hypothetical protein
MTTSHRPSRLKTPRFMYPEIALSKRELDALSMSQLRARREVLLKAAH